MDDLLNHPETRRSIALEAFLTLSGYEDFTKKKKQLDDLFLKKELRMLITKKNLELYRKVTHIKLFHKRFNFTTICSFWQLFLEFY